MLIGCSNGGFSNVETACGSMGLRRSYNTSGVPTSLASSPAASDVAANRVSWLSLSGLNPANITNGSNDTAIRNFVINVGSHPMMLTFNHEPENDGYTAASFKAASEYFYDLVKGANSSIWVGPIFMGYTYDPTSGLTISDWSPGTTKMDFSGIDFYNPYHYPLGGNGSTWFDVPTWNRIANYFTYINSHSGVAPAIGEFGTANWTETGVSGHPPDNGTASPVGTRKSGWIDTALHYFEDRGAVACCYFDSTVNNDIDPSQPIETDQLSINVWTSWTSTHQARTLNTMTGLTTAESQATLDARFPTSGGGDYVAYSTNGTSEATTVLARTSVGATGWASATSADPSVKANTSALTSATASAGGTITHFAIYSASSGGTQRTDWTALATSRTLVTGDQLTWAIGALQVTLT